MNKYLLLLLSLLFSLPGYSTTYYVAKTGADTNSGTEASPFLTISKAASMMVAGDSCVIKEGVYREVLSPQANGTSSQPIVFTSFAGDSVLISATEPAGTWIQASGDMYRTPYNMTLGRKNMVFVDQRPMDWARWPNNVDHDPYTLESIEVVTGTGSSVEAPDIDNTDWTGGYIWYLGAHSGTSWTREITASQTGKIDFIGVNINQWPFNPHNPTIVRNGNRGRFYLFGVLSALDYAEEWYFDDVSNQVFFQAPGNVDPNTLQVEFSARQRTMNIDRDYIIIDGIHAFGGKVEITGENCIIRNGYFKQCLQTLDELDNTDAQAGEGAIHIRGSFTTIENNTIDGSSISGIYIQGWNNVTHPLIQHNVIKNCNTVGIHASPIRSASTHNRFLSNTIMTTGRDGIYCAGVNNEIAYNDISDCMKLNNDGGLFYTVGNANSRNTEIHHNWFHDSEGPDYADGRAAGIYLDNDSKGYTVHHNVVWNITWSGVQMNWDIWDNNIYHNTLWNVGDAMGTWLKPEHTMERIKVYNNVASTEEWIGNDIQSNKILSNDHFEDIDNHDFRPKWWSSLIDDGMAIPGINDDYQGSAPDLGAYERGLTPWIPGVNSVEGGEVDMTTTVEPIQQVRLLVHPNPAKDSNVTISLQGVLAPKTIAIYNLAGQEIFETIESGEHLVVPYSVFGEAGLYFIQVQTADRNWAGKLIVQ
ncbi:T9SS type A sorting domain-containing protein [Pontibacter sp. G13]|uniref:T9SS type A sorting domain-containing protein n=1 Tax=Pontibacter sp. G13 TaxID=3074898 RepID=UPI00288B1123|nr:right-handed parallel beta-helix repeat-containing protein [Pontibacter sp. G13]WNJ18674.1 right-handed parallel beta-helix repeat-containing protein [Pontibacter sp. G13]